MMTDFFLYLHVPFCSSKCHFCNWVVDISPRQLTKSQPLYEEYTDAVLRQLDSYSGAFKQQSARIKAIYFGGGTPTALPANHLSELLSAASSSFDRAEDFSGITTEISPESVSAAKLDELRRAGFDRISIGVQSFEDERLRRTGRAHTRDTAIRAFQEARRAGFDNINLDLMLGMPGETFREWEETLKTGLSLAPDHFSLYVYRQVPGTVLSRSLDKGRSSAVPPTEVAQRYFWASDLLSENGYNEYLFQLFERGGKKCDCDLWSFNLECDYLGFGAGAHSLMRGRLFGHGPDLQKYLANPTRPGYEGPAHSAEGVLATKVYQLLHTAGGVNYETFNSRLGISFKQACEEVPRVRDIYRDLQSKNLVGERADGFGFKDRESKVKWFCGV
jgi:putative oxygen-independent coproporphyrinogen III oxidase